VTIVETSNVGVKVGMVGRGVMDGVGVTEGSTVRVAVGIGDGVAVMLSMTETGVTVPDGAHADARIKIAMKTQKLRYIFPSCKEVFMR